MSSEAAVIEHRFKVAADHLAEGFAIANTIEQDVPKRKVQILEAQGDLYAAQANWPESIQSYKEALALARQINSGSSSISLMIAIAFAYLRSNVFGQAQFYLIEAAKRSEQSQNLFYANLLLVSAIYFEA